MKTHYTSNLLRLTACLVLAGLVSACGRSQKSDGPGAADSRPASDGPKAIAIVAAPNVTDETLLVTAQYVRANWRTLVRTERVADAAAVKPDADDACLLVLINDPASSPDPLDSVRITGRKAVQNIAAMDKEPALLPNDEPAVFQRLVNKEAMRAIGLMLGMELCPFSQCGLYQPKTIAELRYKGQNYCPPCQGKMRDARDRNGLEYMTPTPKRQAAPGQ